MSKSDTVEEQQIRAAYATIANLNSEPHVRYGELKDGVFIAGFTFARACSTLEWLLEDGHWIELGYTDVNAFLDSIQLDELRPTVEARKRIAQRIKQLQPKASLRQIGRTLGVSHPTVMQDVGENSPRTSDKSKGINRPTAQNGRNLPLASDKSQRINNRITGTVPNVTPTSAKSCEQLLLDAEKLVRGLRDDQPDDRTKLYRLADDAVETIHKLRIAVAENFAGLNTDRA